MDLILTAYSPDTYKEYCLPQQAAGTRDLLLPSAPFGLPEDLRIAVRYQDGHPEFPPSGLYTLRPALGTRRFPLPVKDGGVYFLMPVSGGRIVLTVRAAKRAPAFSVYPLDGDAPFTVGSGPENSLVYGGERGYISKLHAAIAPEGGGRRLEAPGLNGLYLNCRRLKEPTVPLAFGDQIYILGLLLVYQGDSVAVDMTASGLLVREGLQALDGMQDTLDRALAVHGLRLADNGGASGDAAGAAGETVLLQENASGVETVLIAEDETVLEEDDGSDGETVLEEAGDSGGGTVLEEAENTDDETVLEMDDDSDDETVLEDLDDADDETVFEEDEDDTILD